MGHLTRSSESASSEPFLIVIKSGTSIPTRLAAGTHASEICTASLPLAESGRRSRHAAARTTPAKQNRSIREFRLRNAGTDRPPNNAVDRDEPNQRRKAAIRPSTLCLCSNNSRRLRIFDEGPCDPAMSENVPSVKSRCTDLQGKRPRQWRAARWGRRAWKRWSPGWAGGDTSRRRLC